MVPSRRMFAGFVATRFRKMSDQIHGLLRAIKSNINLFQINKHLER